MGAPLTESSTFTASVNSCADGEPVNAAEFNDKFQALVNRTRYLLDALTNGVTHVRTVADAAALRAVTSHSNGDVGALGGGGGGRLFIYDAASTLADDGQLIIKPTDVGVGAGRWLNPALVLLSIATGLHFAGHVYFDDGATVDGLGLGVSGACSVGGALSVVGATTCAALTSSGLLKSTSGLDVSGSAALLKAGCTVTGGNLAVALNCSVQSDFSCDGTTTLNNVTINGVAAIAGNTTLSGQLVFAGSGTTRHRAILGADADQTYGIADAEEIVAKTLTANRTYTVSNTGALAGMRMRFANVHTTYTVQVSTPEQGVVGIVGYSVAHQGLELTFIGGRWERTL